MTTPAGPGPGPQLPAVCALRPGQPLVQSLASLHLSSQCSSASASGHSQAPPQSPSSLGSQARLGWAGPRAAGPELGLRPPDAWSLRWGPTTCHPQPDQDLVEVAPALGPGCALATERPHRPRGLVRAPALSRFSHLQSEDKQHDIFQGATACLLSPPGLDSNGFPARNLVLPRPSAQLPPAFLTRTLCWPCPAKSLTHKDHRAQLLQP